MRKLAVLRANALGDYMFSLPALEALRAAYPQAEVVLLGQPWHAAFLQDRPGPVDRVIAVPPSRGVHWPRRELPCRRRGGRWWPFIPARVTPGVAGAPGTLPESRTR